MSPSKEVKEKKRDLISVCVCTYKRPKMLARALKHISLQTLNDQFLVEIVVVDNDRGQSAAEIVAGFRRGTFGRTRYVVEPEQNISAARNKAVESSSGNFIVFIDDDEFPEKAWLINLLSSCEKYLADGVLGPVLPFFAGKAPEWLIKSNLCVRDSFPTGFSLHDSKYMRTGNVLLRKEIVDGIEEPFDPKYGLTGSEDVDFFGRMLRKGHKFVWCNEAKVYEEVPEDRQNRRYYLKRALMRGTTAATRTPFFGLGTIKSLTAVVWYSTSLPVLFLLGQHLFMKILVKLCDHLSKLLAYVGIKLIHERTW